MTERSHGGLSAANRPIPCRPKRYRIVTRTTLAFIAPVTLCA
jgi:hypothetical protein